MCTRINGLEYYGARYCTATYCGGPLVINPAFATVPTMTMTSASYQGTAPCSA